MIKNLRLGMLVTRVILQLYPNFSIHAVPLYHERNFANNEGIPVFKCQNDGIMCQKVFGFATLVIGLCLEGITVKIY